jgi:prepilin-type N-terminal cleavage/methylation domain-containing protein
MPIRHGGRSAKRRLGFTLLELIVAATILSILTMMALPLARLTIQREKEKDLRSPVGDARRNRQVRTGGRAGRVSDQGRHLIPHLDNSRIRSYSP